MLDTVAASERHPCDDDDELANLADDSTPGVLAVLRGMFRRRDKPRAEIDERLLTG